MSYKFVMDWEKVWEAINDIDRRVAILERNIDLLVRTAGLRDTFQKDTITRLKQLETFLDTWGEMQR